MSRLSEGTASKFAIRSGCFALAPGARCSTRLPSLAALLSDFVGYRVFTLHFPCDFSALPSIIFSITRNPNEIKEIEFLTMFSLGLLCICWKGEIKMDIQKLKSLLSLSDAIVSTVQESGPLGAPGGHIYMALSQHGCTLPQYEQIMGALVDAGKLRRGGDCYFAS